VRQRGLRRHAVHARLRSPIPEGTPESVDGTLDAQLADELLERCAVTRELSHARKTSPDVPVISTARIYSEVARKRASEPFAEEAAYRYVAWLAPRQGDPRGRCFSRSGRPLPGRHCFLGT
jgi:hypothetical protein